MCYWHRCWSIIQIQIGVARNLFAPDLFATTESLFAPLPACNCSSERPIFWLRVSSWERKTRDSPTPITATIVRSKCASIESAAKMLMWPLDARWDQSVESLWSGSSSNQTAATARCTCGWAAPDWSAGGSLWTLIQLASADNWSYLNSSFAFCFLLFCRFAIYII